MELLHQAAILKLVKVIFSPCLSHEIPPQDIRHAALLLDDAAEWFPADTIHVAVVDPGIDLNTRSSTREIGRQQFIAPDNGLLSRLASRTPPSKLIRLADPAYWLERFRRPSTARVVAPCATDSRASGPGSRPRPAWPAVCGFRLQLDWPGPRHTSRRLDGAVIEIDAFGNLITNLTADIFAGRPDRPPGVVVCNIYETWGIYHAYAEQPSGMLVAVSISSKFGRLELAIVGDNAARRLGIDVGSPVTLAWE